MKRLAIFLVLTLTACCPAGYIKAENIEGTLRRVITLHDDYIWNDETLKGPENDLERGILLNDGTVLLRVLDEAKAARKAQE